MTGNADCFRVVIRTPCTDAMEAREAGEGSNTPMTRMGLSVINTTWKLSHNHLLLERDSSWLADGACLRNLCTAHGEQSHLLYSHMLTSTGRSQSTQATLDRLQPHVGTLDRFQPLLSYYASHLPLQQQYQIATLHSHQHSAALTHCGIPTHITILQPQTATLCHVPSLHMFQQ